MIHFGPGAFAAAFAAGIVSFVSPCVLPLIPGYLSFVSGVGFDELGAQPRRVVGQTAWFVLGFGVMFALLGAGAAWFGNALLVHRRSLEIPAGAFVVLAGLIYAGLRRQARPGSHRLPRARRHAGDPRDRTGRDPCHRPAALRPTCGDAGAATTRRSRRRRARRRP